MLAAGASSVGAFTLRWSQALGHGTQGDSSGPGKPTQIICIGLAPAWTCLLQRPVVLVRDGQPGQQRPLLTQLSAHTGIPDAAPPAAGTVHECRCVPLPLPRPPVQEPPRPPRTTTPAGPANAGPQDLEGPRLLGGATGTSLAAAAGGGGDLCTRIDSTRSNRSTAGTAATASVANSGTDAVLSSSLAVSGSTSSHMQHPTHMSDLAASPSNGSHVQRPSHMSDVAASASAGKHVPHPTHVSNLAASASNGSHVHRPSHTSDHAAAVRAAYGMLAPSGCSGASSSRAVSCGIGGGGSGVGGLGLGGGGSGAGGLGHAGGSGVGGLGHAGGGSGVGGMGRAGGSGQWGWELGGGSSATHASATHGPGGVPFGTPLPDRSQPQHASLACSHRGAAAGGQVGGPVSGDSGAGQSARRTPSPFVAGAPWRSSSALRTTSNSDMTAAAAAAAVAGTQEHAAGPLGLEASGPNGKGADGVGTAPACSSEESRAFVAKMAGQVRQWAAMYGRGDGADWRAGLAAARDHSDGIVRMLEYLAAWEPGKGTAAGGGAGGGPDEAAGGQSAQEPAGPKGEDGGVGSSVAQASGRGDAAAVVGARGAGEAVMVDVARALGRSHVRALLGALELTERLEAPCMALLRYLQQLQQQQRSIAAERAKQRPRRRSLVLLLGCCGQQGGGGVDGGTGGGTQRSSEEVEVAAAAAGLRCTLAWVKASGGRAEQGVEDARASFAELCGARGERHPDTLDAMGVLAEVVLGCGRKEEAWELCGRLVELRRGAVGEEHPDTIRCVLHVGVARAAKQSGRRRDTAKADGLFAHHGWLVARSYVCCALCCGAAHGVFTCRRCLLMHACMPSTDCASLAPAAPSHVHCALSASTAAGPGTWPVSTLRDLHAPNPRQRTPPRALYDAALCALALGRPAAAEPLLRSCLQLRRQTLGTDEHPAVASNLHALARCLATAQGDANNSSSTTNSSTSFTNAKAAGKQRLAEAEKLHREALAVRQKLYGKGAPLLMYGAGTGGRELSDSLLEVARVVQKQGRLGDAEGVYREAWEAMRRALGEGHPETAAAGCALAGCLADQGRVEEAAAEYRRALEVLVRAKGEGHPEVVEVVNKLAVCMCLRGRWVRGGSAGGGVRGGLMGGCLQCRLVRGVGGYA